MGRGVQTRILLFIEPGQGRERPNITKMEKRHLFIPLTPILPAQMQKTFCK